MSSFGGEQTAIDDMVATVCREVLQLDEIRPDEDLFDLGLESLVAMRIVSRLQMQLGQVIPLILIFDNPTIASFAAALAISVAKEEDEVLRAPPLHPTANK